MCANHTNQFAVAAIAILKEFTWDEKVRLLAELDSPIGYASFVAYLETCLWAENADSADDGDLFHCCEEVVVRIWMNLDYQRSL